MERFLIIISISGLLLSGCNLFNSDEEDEKIEPYTWVVYKAPVTANLLNVDEDDILYTGGENYWAISLDKGKTFKTYLQPDTVQFEMIKRFGNTFYAIGEYEVTELILWNPTRVKSNGLFRSQDGNNWELILGPFKMYDFLIDDDGYLHVAKYNGVSTIDLSTDTEYLNEFLFTNSIDMISDLEKNSKGEVFAGCHDGVYKTVDNGANWIRVSNPDVPKHLDDVNTLHIDEEDRIFAIAGRRLLLSLDHGNTWTIHEIMGNRATQPDKWDTFYPGGISFTDPGFVYSHSFEGLHVAHFDSVDLFYSAGPEGYNYESPFNYYNLQSFSDGSVILQRGEILISGKINPESDFWEKRGWQELAAKTY